MLLEIIGLFILITFVIGTPFFILAVIKTAIREGVKSAKQDITINFNQSAKQPDLEILSEIAGNLAALSSAKEVLQIPAKSELPKLKDNEGK